jgi:putative ATP-dependent endonuclease of OLD family
VRIDSVTISSFRCFGPADSAIKFSDVTALVGSNGCGKSAALQSLVRLFGTTQAERTLHRSDFHLPPGSDWEDQTEVVLRIEAVLTFPEIADSEDFDEAAAACFKHMTVDDPGAPPYCRIRLDGKWTRGNLPEGEIEQTLVWVKTPLSETGEEQLVRVEPHDRSRIHVHYIPAVRDPVRQIRQVSGSMLHSLLKAVEWSEGVREKVTDSSEAMREAFGNEEGVKEIQAAIERTWRELHAAPEYGQVNIRPVAKRLEDLIKQVEAIFTPGHDDQENGVERLSDGQKSLFYLALVAAVFDVQDAVGGSGASHLSRKELDPPILNVFAAEEPENHVAPHYLGRIMDLFRRVATSERGQVIVTSHSASILARIEPDEVQHLRLDPEARTTTVSGVTLPDESHDAHKFVREAVKAYPELYFARIVILCEGDSEEVVIPRLAAANGLPIDRSFVSVVPLGGRHVNHFWRLLDQLSVPYLTLLDYDRERQGGGWARIKYVLEQLLALGRDEATVLRYEEDGKPIVAVRDVLETMSGWEVTDYNDQKKWIASLEAQGVFFSYPLDLDYSMLLAFTDAYKATVGDDAEGPDIPEDEADLEVEIENVVKAVLKKTKTGGKTFGAAAKKLFFWYRYLFLGRGKPSTHILALANLSDELLRTKAPRSLNALVARVMQELAAAEEEDDATC